MRPRPRLPSLVTPLLRLTAFSILIAAFGCIAVPTQMPDEKPFLNDQLAFVEIGSTTKEQIARAMSNFAISTDEGEVRVKLYPQKFRGGDWWLYTRDREEFQWFYAMAYEGAAYGTVGDVDYHFLLIKFNDDGVVSEYEVSSNEGKGCNRAGVCQEGLNYMLLAPDDEDKASKQFRPPADRCGVYLYGDPQLPVETWVDGQPAGSLLNKKLYLFWQLEAGRHHLYIRAIRPSSRQNLPSADFERRSIHFDCIAGDTHFFEHVAKLRREGWWEPTSRLMLELRQARPTPAKEAISKRQLVLSSWDASHQARPVILSPDMALNIIQVGVTTREDLIARFGPPEIDSIKHGLMVFIKDWPEWFKLIGVENGPQTLGQQYLLFVRLESEGIPSGYELRSINPKLDSSIAYMTSHWTPRGYTHVDKNLNCTASGYCVAQGGMLARYAPADESKNAVRSKAQKNECLISVFNEEQDTGWRIMLDGQLAGYIHDGLWPRAFLQWRLPVGEYSVAAETVDAATGTANEQLHSASQLSSATLQIACKEEHEYYLPLRLNRSGVLLHLMDDRLGEDEIRRRNLIHSEF